MLIKILFLWSFYFGRLLHALFSLQKDREMQNILYQSNKITLNANIKCINELYHIR